MPESENPQNHSNAAPISSNGPLDIIQEGMKRMNIIEKKENCVDEGIEYPDRPGEPDCRYYVRTGRCGYADTCRYNHPRPVQTELSKNELPQREGQPDCGHFLKTGYCKYGSTCKYHHPLDRHGAEEVPLNTLGLPLRKEKPCPYYLRTRNCKFGSACKFDHPQPTSVEAALPVSGATAVGMGSSSLSPSISYVAPLPAWSWGKSPPIPGSHGHGYMSYYCYYPNPAATQNWNSYLGNMSSVAAASGVVGTDFAYKNPGELVPGQADLLKMASSIYPERPDEPECRFYMSTGGCRFGSNCKYHHPKDRIGHILGPHGLPLRPGAPLCGNFSSHNVCNYGPTCKYDHPITGYGYYLGMASASGLNQPFIPKPKYLPVANSTDQSKSSKITDWIQKPETVGVENSQQPVTKAIEDSHDKVADQSNAVAAASAEIPKDQSD